MRQVDDLLHGLSTSLPVLPTYRLVINQQIRKSHAVLDLDLQQRGIVLLREVVVQGEAEPFMLTLLMFVF